MGANNGTPVSSAAGPLYRVHSEGCDLEVFDARVVVIERRIGAERLSGEVQRLAELREKGVLSDDEFAAAKRRVINGSA